MALPYQKLGLDFDPLTAPLSQLDSFYQGVVNQDKAYKNYVNQSQNNTRSQLATLPTSNFTMGGLGSGGVIAGTEKVKPVDPGTIQANLLAYPDFLSKSYEEKRNIFSRAMDDLSERKLSKGPLNFLTDPRFAIPAIVGAGLTLGLSGGAGVGGGSATGGGFGGASGAAQLTPLEGLGGFLDIPNLAAAGTGPLATGFTPSIPATLGTAGSGSFLSTLAGGLKDVATNPFGRLAGDVVEKLIASDSIDEAKTLLKDSGLSAEDQLKAFEGSRAFKNQQSILDPNFITNDPQTQSLISEILRREKRKGAQSGQMHDMSKGMVNNLLLSGELSGVIDAITNRQSALGGINSPLIGGTVNTLNAGLGVEADNLVNLANLNMSQPGFSLLPLLARGAGSILTSDRFLDKIGTLFS